MAECLENRISGKKNNLIDTNTEKTLNGYGDSVDLPSDHRLSLAHSVNSDEPARDLTRYSDDYTPPEHTTSVYERFKPKLMGSVADTNKSSRTAHHVYISPRISLRSKHLIRDSRDEESMPVAARTKLEVLTVKLLLM